ncbi:MAG: hypothetical protein ACE5K4_06405 [Candidatus Hydrothermarchaeota archaeon]
MNDSFVLKVLLLMVLSVLGIIVSAYYGSKVGELQGTDALVEDLAMKSAGKKAVTLIELNETGEYIGFTLVGIVSGFTVGYLIPSLFPQKIKKG